MNILTHKVGLIIALLIFSHCVSAKEQSVPITNDSPYVRRTVLIDVVRAKDRLVAVGERGVILFSDDDAATWHLANVPVSGGLTTVFFVDANNGWAAGHAGVILHTVDGGANWQLQLDGEHVAKLELASAQEDVENSIGESRNVAQARLAAATNLVADGSDKPFLALDFTDQFNGVAVGAFGIAVRTTDGGATWTSLMGEIENPTGLHLYGVGHFGNNSYIVGEQGFFARADDKTHKYFKLNTPYGGTFFTLSVMPLGDVLVAGLKGNIYITKDHGKSFKEVQNSVPATVNSSLVLPRGQVLLATQAGQVLVVGQDEKNAELWGTTQSPISGLAQTHVGAVVTVGFAGLKAVYQIK